MLLAFLLFVILERKNFTNVLRNKKRLKCYIQPNKLIQLAA